MSAPSDQRVASSPATRGEDEPIESYSAPRKSDPGSGHDPPLVLVVERDAHVRELVAHFLGRAGYRVELAEDGPSGLARARALVPDLMITEILVPKLDGLALCRQIKSDPATASISVLVFSILAASGRATEAGADAFLIKPLAERRLVTAVQSLLEKRPSREGRKNYG